MPSATEPTPGILLDTHAALWLMSGEVLGEEISRTINDAATSSGVFVSPISAWEIATLVRKGRIVLSLAPDSWFDKMLDAGVQLAPMPPRTLIASAFLPGDLHGDPVDRIIAATARSENLVLVTRDTKLLAYAKQGNMRALPC